MQPCFHGISEMDLCYMPVLLFRTVNPVKCQDVLCKVIFFPLIPSAFIFVFIIENKICSSSPTPQKKKMKNFPVKLYMKPLFFDMHMKPFLFCTVSGRFHKWS